ncbi:ABC transporter ATP-binding protein [Hoeflea prorocentri]|uniref:ABC transporter ATP-binding protein n=1 Tax=Hoeflea prorocentri TaxID=1922333 RepID=A0A9X3ZHG7_9HYPH|nr:ABC transporter ATP-binding protein [Hoeflea prorocentri]MCY6381807.1 ABC transporter ATP-binding protein [Hoeflea prorocentri]MDA5399607.1 ABC transporter ATP-binding protein [Hoeflea prorocentri]
MSDNPLLSISGLEVFYGPIAALRGVGLEVNGGEVVALLGSNGAGKTTTLLSIAGVLPVRAGEIRFDGIAITGQAVERIARSGIALVPEGRHVFEGLTVKENLLMGAASLPRGKVEDEWHKAFDLFPILAERRFQLAGTLSGGEQQMLAIGRALMSRPRVLLLDEPSLGLAPRIVEEIFELIVLLRKQGTTILLVEQNARMALEVADRGYVMSQGRIAAEGTASELVASDEVARAYLGVA